MSESLIGQIVADRYKVLDKMGEGGMGTVYLAEHVAIEKKLALKVLLPEYARKPDLKERFLREARAAAAIRHENIVDITDFGDTPDKSVFFAMEYLDGFDLAHHIKTNGAMEWPRAKRILLQVCRALGAAHAKKIVHRDMKPENIFLVDREGRADFVKVLDFGIAKVSGATDGEPRLTRTGMIFGTPEYMSPEQAQGHSPDHRVDIYAVGVIMYEVLTGQVPFKADTFMGILTKHIFEEPIPPSQVEPQGAFVPADAEAIVLKALKKDREDRFQSMTEMAAAISQATGRMGSVGNDGSGPARILDSQAPGTNAAQITLTPAPRRGGQVDDVSAEDMRSVGLSGRKRAIGLVFALLILVGAGIGAAMWFRKAAKSEGTKAAVTQQQRSGSKQQNATALNVTMQINSVPAGAKVFMGTRMLGETPAAITLVRAEKQVMLTLTHDGYEAFRQPVVPDKSGKVVNATLTKIANESNADNARSNGKPAVGASHPNPDDNEAARVGGRSLRERRARRIARRRARVRANRRIVVSDPQPKPPRRQQQKKPNSEATPRRVEDLMDPF